MVTATVVDQASTHGPSPLPQNVITFTRQPMADKSVVAVVNYVEPQVRRDPNVAFTPLLESEPRIRMRSSQALRN
jgi:hypothetical protein